MNRYVLTLALAASVAAETQTCGDGQYFDEDLGECDDCIQFTTDLEKLNLVQGGCPAIEYVEPVCTAVLINSEQLQNMTGRRILCGGMSLYAAAVSVAITSYLLY